MTAAQSTAALILAGGEATRLPGKLERPVANVPLLLRTYRNVRAIGVPTYVAGRGGFPAAIDEALDCPLLVDRWPRGGPLAALVSACAEIPQERVFVVAADAPMVDGDVYRQLAGAWREGDAAVVPEHGGRREPLAALYGRSHVLRDGFSLMRENRPSMHALLERLAPRFVPLADAYFLNVNEAADLQRAAKVLA